MATILDTLKKGTGYLEKHRIDEARLSMEHLIAHVLRIERMQLYLDFDRPLSEEALEKLRDLTKRRSQGEPLQHLLGTVEFCDLEFATDARALVPRPETEELTMLLLATEFPEGARILDMGCGSGVIGHSLAHHLADQNVTVDLVDLSPEAVALARENEKTPGRVDYLESDLFANVTGQYDLIVANLPYIPDADETRLSREVQRDPRLALYGGVIGTEIILRFYNDSLPFLKSGGRIALEYGQGQDEILRIAAEDAGFDQVETKADLSGIERFLFAVKPGDPC